MLYRQVHGYSQFEHQHSLVQTCVPINPYIFNYFKIIPVYKYLQQTDISDVVLLSYCSFIYVSIDSYVLVEVGAGGLKLHETARGRHA